MHTCQLEKSIKSQEFLHISDRIYISIIEHPVISAEIIKRISV